MLWPKEEEEKNKSVQKGKTETFAKKGRFRVLLNKLKETFPSACIIDKEELRLAPSLLAQTDVHQFELLQEKSSIEDYKKVALLYRGKKWQ